MKTAALLMTTIALAACASGLKTKDVALGMSKEDVVKTMGQPHGVIASERVGEHASEVLEYRRDGLWWGDLDETYWFYFTDNKLERWNRPGDHLRHLE